jgi:hypothetical protein
MSSPVLEENQIYDLDKTRIVKTNYVMVYYRLKVMGYILKTGWTHQ